MSSEIKKEFSNESDEEELSGSEEGNRVSDTLGGKGIANQPYDEMLEVSGSEISEGIPSPQRKGAKEVRNQPYDEALELSVSASSMNSPMKSPMSGGAKSPIGFKSSTLASSIPENEVSYNKDKEKQVIKNKPHDEEEDLSDSGSSVDTVGQPSPIKKSEPKSTVASTTNASSLGAKTETTKIPTKEKEETHYNTKTAISPSTTSTTTQPKNDTKSKQTKLQLPSEDESEGEDKQSTKSSPSPQFKKDNTKTLSKNSPVRAGQYNESDYANLNVSHEIQELFQYIGRYKSQELELDTKLKCFVSEYIPSVGEIDPFLKVAKPDGKPDYLGLHVLDEPAYNQSDATVLDLQMRAVTKKKHGDLLIRSIENAEKNPKEIDKWIKNISELHRSKPPPQVHYSKNMPSIEDLMQLWPEQFEQELKDPLIPDVNIDMKIEDYAKVICNILDIPVYKNICESLHLIFTLYIEFRNNQHFMKLGNVPSQ